jgi:hypothetical protein
MIEKAREKSDHKNNLGRMINLGSEDSFKSNFFQVIHQPDG